MENVHDVFREILLAYATQVVNEVSAEKDRKRRIQLLRDAAVTFSMCCTKISSFDYDECGGYVCEDEDDENDGPEIDDECSGIPPMEQLVDMMRESIEAFLHPERVSTVRETPEKIVSRVGNSEVTLTKDGIKIYLKKGNHNAAP